MARKATTTATSTKAAPAPVKKTASKPAVRTKALNTAQVSIAAQEAAWPVETFIFDSEWYLESYPDVAGVDPVQHFLNYGYAEGRNPNPYFSCAAYLEANPDVANASINPFTHFVFYGAKEGRPTKR